MMIRRNFTRDRLSCIGRAACHYGSATPGVQGSATPGVQAPQTVAPPITPPQPPRPIAFQGPPAVGTAANGSPVTATGKILPSGLGGAAAPWMSTPTPKPVAFQGTPATPPATPAIKGFSQVPPLASSGALDGGASLVRPIAFQGPPAVGTAPTSGGWNTTPGPTGPPVIMPGPITPTMSALGSPDGATQSAALANFLGQFLANYRRYNPQYATPYGPPATTPGGGADITAGGQPVRIRLNHATDTTTQTPPVVQPPTTALPPTDLPNLLGGRRLVRGNQP